MCISCRRGWRPRIMAWIFLAAEFRPDRNDSQVSRIVVAAAWASSVYLNEGKSGGRGITYHSNDDNNNKR